MVRRGLLLLFLFLFLLVVTLTFSSGWVVDEGNQNVPAYNPAPPTPDKKLPPILGKDQLWGENARYPFQTHAYELASKIPVILYQQPCYCYCDRGMGHNSLHSCFEGTHGAECTTCLKELYYSYVEHKKGKTAKQIRAGILQGEWKQIDLHAAATIN